MSRRLPELVLKGVDGTSARLDIEFEVIGVDPKLTERSLIEITDAFVRGGEFGGYPMAGMPPRNCRMLQLPRAAGMTGLGLTIQAEGVDPYAFQCLRNMAARLRIEEIEVHRVTVRSLEAIAIETIVVPEPDEDNEEEVYPIMSDLLGFETSWEELEPSWVRRCLIEHQNSLLSEQVLDIAKWIDPWYELLEEGAFAMPWESPEEADSLRGSISQFDDVTIEIAVDRFQASECAWNVLVNLIEGYRCTGWPVSKVDIE